MKNHGEYVSGVAHSTPPGPEHGKTVSAAARSDCGKDKEAEASGTEDEQEPPESDEQESGEQESGGQSGGQAGAAHSGQHGHAG